ncbi:MAG: polymerase, sigma-24 subunit, subfamily [Frankiales bacterium]|nr:polymerase, sigma-24 subunit, subfamily [Frankiales bacterium]
MSDSSGPLYAQIVLPHLDEAYALARCLAGNPADAEDIVQEACLRALKSIKTYAGGSSRAWLLTIVRNAAFTWMARRKPGRLMVESINTGAPDGAELVADPLPTPEAALIARADARSLERAMADLPTPFREVLVLREYNEMSYRDISDVMQIPVGTVMSRLARARQLLMHALAPDLQLKSAP